MIEPRPQRELYGAVDLPLVLAVLALLAIGVCSIYSAAGGAAGRGWFFASRQLVWSGLALAVSLAMFWIDFRWLLHWGYVIHGVCCLILVAVLALGLTAKGAQSWFHFGWFNMQPSEFVKIGLALVMAQQMSLFPPETMPRFLGALALGGIAGLLVLLQPDLGSTMVYGIMIFMGLWAGGAPAKWLAVLAGSAVSSLPILWFFLKDFQKNRLLVFLQPSLDPMGVGYNVIQSRIAVGSGRLFGKGFMAGTQSKLRFLPEPHTDFVFSVFAEEFGFIGCLVVLALFTFVFWRCLSIALCVKSRSQKVWITMVTAWIWFQFFEAVAMSMGLMPITGLPLPFMSYGGSSLLATSIAFAFMVKLGALSRIKQMENALPTEKMIYTG